MHRALVVRCCGLALVMLAMCASLAAVELPPDEAYVQVQDGHLTRAGQRVRYWGFIGFPWGQALLALQNKQLTPAARATAIVRARADIDLTVQRIHDLGFNLVRSWHPISTDPYTMGDGSDADLLAYYFVQLERKGIMVWQAMTNQHNARFTAADVGIIDDPTTAAAWSAAMTEWVKTNKGEPIGGWTAARVWDPRIEAITLADMRRRSQFKNLYKGGLILADDPQMAVWELTNEESWYLVMFGGSHWATMPAFFRNELLTLWCGFLNKKYGSDERLTAAWGFLVPGESLAKNTIMLLPLGSPSTAAMAVNDTNPEAIAKLSSVEKPYAVGDFTVRRGEDVIEFLTGLYIAHKQRTADALRTFGKGCRLSPCIWETGSPFQIQNSYLHQFSDASVSDTYVKGMGNDPTAKRWPFHSGLDASPRMCWNVPWVEQARQKGKPFFCYEIQIDCRTKYRAEFPYRVAAICAIQDWDIVNWHTYDSGVDSSSPDPFGNQLHVWHDYFGFGQDEVQLSAMKASAETFKHSLLAPAPAPTTFIFGRKSLYSPASMSYGKSFGDFGRRFIPTCYRYGAQVVIDPTREDDAIIGPSLSEDVYAPNPVRPTDQIEYDWSLGHLMFDAPGVIGYVGFSGQRTAPLTFRDGSSFTGITIDNPPGIAYPVTPAEGYVAIMVVSQDGQPLARTAKALVSAVSTSFNTGYRLDLTKSTPGNHGEGPVDSLPQEFFGAYAAQPGTAPVQVARVGATIICNDLRGMSYTFRDWQLHDIGHGVLTDGVLTIPATLPVFVVELTR